LRRTSVAGRAAVDGLAVLAAALEAVGASRAGGLAVLHPLAARLLSARWDGRLRVLAASARSARVVAQREDADEREGKADRAEVLLSVLHSVLPWVRVSGVARCTPFKGEGTPVVT